MSRPSIALCAIMKNEEPNIARLLDSVRGCVDEVYITDTGSTDDSVNIAKKHGANISFFNWVNDFSAARNFNFAQAKTDYILWLDLDDTLENQDEFSVFTNDIMKIADYWVAAYDYASDAKTGQSVCAFARERVIRNNIGLKWEYFVHEGIKPASKERQIRAEYIPSWRVKHHRTAEDLEKDKGRNLKMFDGRLHQLDSRMKYYYGKELFEAQKPEEAIKWLTQAAIEPTIELHDRILSVQYAAYSAAALGKYDQAVSLAHTGLELAPNRAEFYNIIGDSYMKLGRLIDAKPSFEAARKCEQTIPAHIASPIFSFPGAYGEYPALQVAAINANLGRFDAALMEARAAFLEYNSENARKLMEEIKRVKDLTIPSYQSAVPCADIVITTPPQNAYEWDADIYKEKSMGGSETAAIEMAHWLHQLSGRPVKIFNMRTSDKTCDGVEYISTEKTIQYMSKHKPYLHIAWRHNIKLTDAPTFLWCHDLTTPGGEVHANYEKMLCLTPFHGRHVEQMQRVPRVKIHVTRNGINPGKFIDRRFNKNKFQFIFSSSPDRGLDRCMLVLDEVRKTFPEVTLHIAYGIEHLEKYGLKGLQDKLFMMMNERKDWVIYHGALEQSKLFDLMRESAYCVQPSDFIETSMISAVERLCCGVYAIMRKVGGCADTLAEAEKNGMATLVDSDCIEPSQYQLYIDATIAAIKEEAYKRVLVDPYKYAWRTVAKEWLDKLPFFAYSKTSS